MNPAAPVTRILIARESRFSSARRAGGCCRGSVPLGLELVGALQVRDRLAAAAEPVERVAEVVVGVALVRVGGAEAAELLDGLLEERHCAGVVARPGSASSPGRSASGRRPPAQAAAGVVAAAAAAAAVVCVCDRLADRGRPARAGDRVASRCLRRRAAARLTIAATAAPIAAGERAAARSAAATRAGRARRGAARRRRTAACRARRAGERVAQLTDELARGAIARAADPSRARVERRGRSRAAGCGSAPRSTGTGEFTCAAASAVGDSLSKGRSTAEQLVGDDRERVEVARRASRAHPAPARARGSRPCRARCRSGSSSPSPPRLRSRSRRPARSPRSFSSRFAGLTSRWTIPCR